MRKQIFTHLLASCVALGALAVDSVTVMENSSHKLRVCSSGNPPWDSLRRTHIHIPTFAIDKWTYELRKYEIDNVGSLKRCPNGEAPDTFSRTVLSKADYDRGCKSTNCSATFIFGSLLNSTFLFDNGYLSVGNGSESIAKYYSPQEFCIQAINDDESQGRVSFRACPFSKSRPKIRKCCPLGMALSEEPPYCIKHTNIEKWDPRYMDARSWKMLSPNETNPVYTFLKLSCTHETRESFESDGCILEFHPVTDNTIAFVDASRSWKFLRPDDYEWCFDEIQLSNDGTQVTQPFLAFCPRNATLNIEPDNKHNVSITVLYIVTMYIGALFNLLTTFIYLITWTKQNIHGRTLCSCTGSLFLMQTFYGTAHLLGHRELNTRSVICIANGICAQYFKIATFTWFVVVNFDLWRTFRSMRTENGGKSLKRFLIYSSFGWLFPLLVSAISITLELNFRCRVSGIPVPEFGHYYCFVAPWAQGFYVYYILSILIALSWALAVVTFAGLYKIKRDTVNLRSNKTETDKQNILLFLKLSVVMGLTWVFEVIGWLVTKENENEMKENYGWIIVDLYNALSSILIFIIFVCKKAILDMLEHSVPFVKSLTATLSRISEELKSHNMSSSLSAGQKGTALELQKTCPISQPTKETDGHANKSVE